MNNVINVPENLTEDETVEYVRNAIIGLGGNPDTAFPIAVGDDNIVWSTDCLTIELTFKFENDYGKETNKTQET